MNDRFLIYAICIALFLVPLLPVKAQQLKWSSYAGGFGTESFACIATAKSGAVFVAYISDNEDSIITPNAAFPKKRTPFAASVLCKLNADQSIAWATYLTGDSLSSFNVRSIVYDENAHVYVLGTYLGNGFPISNDNTFGALKGGAEAVIAKFDTSGNFIWAKAISSNGFDLPAVSAIDLNGDLWIGGNIAYPNSQPFVGIPITTNAYQPIPNPVNVPNTIDEMFIACIDKSGNLLYSSYFGGSGFEDPEDISVDRNNNIHFLVRTSSTDIIETNNPFKSNLQNKISYVISINKNTLKVNYAAPLPFHPNDVSESLKLGRDNTLYILGKTNNLDSYNPIPESILSNGNTAIVLHAFTPDFKLDKTWAINGFVGNDIGAREIIATDSSLLILLYETKNAIRTNPNAFQKLNNGLIDAFIFKLGYDFKPRWATYLGKSNDDFPLMMCNNGTTNWITGTTRSADYYTSTNAISKKLNDGLGGSTGDVFLTAFDCKSRKVEIISTSTKACLGKPVALKTTEPFSLYNWNDSITTDSIVVTSDTLVQLQVVDTFGCIYFANEQFNFIKPPAAVSFDTTFCKQRKLVLTYQPSDTLTQIMWNTGSNNFSIQTNQSAIYKALVSNVCFTDSFEVNAEAIDCSAKYYVPNAFTPNSDGLNDVFDIIGINFSSRTLNVYNRWGQLIYKADNDGLGWDGTYNGEPVSSDSYVYVFTIFEKLGSTQTVSGTVTVMR